MAHNSGILFREIRHAYLALCERPLQSLARKIHDFRNTEGLAMVQIRYLGGFETKNEAFA
jgi:hypothetical protein